MTFKVWVRLPRLDQLYSVGPRYVTIKYGDVTFDEQRLDERDARDLASELVEAALKLDPDSTEGIVRESCADGINKCCDWLRDNGHEDLADKMLEDEELSNLLI